MGSQTESVFLSEDLLKAQGLNGPRYDAGRILSSALQEWSDTEANRYDYFNGGPAKLYPITPEPLANKVINDADGDLMFRVSPVVPIMDQRDYVIKKRRVTVKLDDAEWHEHMRSYSSGILLKKLAEQLPEEIRDSICGYQIMVTDPKTGKANPEPVWYGDRTAGWKVSSSIDADTSGGKAVTVYQLVIDGRLDEHKSYKTIAEARAAGTKLFEANPNVLKIEVTGKVVREDKTALVKLSRKVRSATAKFEVSYVEVKTDKPRASGCLVEFLYHS